MKLDLVLDAAARPWRPAADVLALAHDLVAAHGPADGRLEVVVGDDRLLHDHNRDYRGKDRPTDVLSFSYLDGHADARASLLEGSSARPFAEDDPAEDDVLVGQVLVSIDTLRERGCVHADGEDGEVLFMITHGLLHVLGFDHEDDAAAQEMEAAERQLFEPVRTRLYGGAGEGAT